MVINITEILILNSKSTSIKLLVRLRVVFLVLLQQHKCSLASELLVNLLFHFLVVAFVTSDLDKEETVWQTL